MPIVMFFVMIINIRFKNWKCNRNFFVDGTL